MESPRVAVIDDELVAQGSRAEIIGHSKPMQEVFRLEAKVSPLTCNADPGHSGQTEERTKPPTQ
jgi:hypothetical protein